MLTKTRPTHYNTRYKHDLSPRQREVLDLIARGKTNAEIANRLGISLDGAKWHVREILGKLDLESREEAAFYWQRYNAPMARLGRAMSALTFGGSTLKAIVVGGTSMLVIAVTAAALITLYSQGDSGTSAAPGLETPVAQTPTAEPAGEQGFRQFAATLDAALRQGDIDVIINRLLTVSYTCTQADFGEGAGRPACDFVGQQFEGFEFSHWRSEGSLSPVTNTETFLRKFRDDVVVGQQDQYGPGQAQVYALGIGDDFQTVITAIIERPQDFGPGGPIRVSLVIPWEFENGQWQAGRIMAAYVLGEEFLDPSPEGRLPGWERYN
jgi:DNA-binding CsgD family transcriptional regulator